MKPKKPESKIQQLELFRVELSEIVDPEHPLVKLSAVVKWEQLEEVIISTYSPDKGRPAISCRMMVSLHHLKHKHNLSDDAVVFKWVENPYWQYFSGMKYFEHKNPIHPSSMSRWRKRIGSEGIEKILKQIIEDEGKVS